MSFTVEQSRGFPEDPPGDYVLEWDQLELRESKTKIEGRSNEFVLHTFKVLEGPEGSNNTFTDTSSNIFSDKGVQVSKLFLWAHAAFGAAAIPDSYSLDSEDLIGRRIRATVGPDPKSGRTKILTAMAVPDAAPPPWEEDLPY